MSKEQFMEGLGKSLAGKVDDNEYRSQMEFYSSYISSEIAAGKSEEEVVSALGDPRLIAKTILQTYSLKDDPIKRQYRESNSGAYGRNEDDYYEKREDGTHRVKRILRIILLVIIMLSVFAFVSRVLVAAIPFLLTLIVVWSIVRIIYQFMNR
ncbi:MAG: DUF1700 domain-containing protein [Lachnospiraceae bacterium]|nr:DUF1700 domain-containing protein [Lachnospiraceae bacterium]